MSDHEEVTGPPAEGDEEEDDAEEEEEEEIDYHVTVPEPVVDVLQIDNEISSTKYRFKKNEIMLCYHGLLLYEVKCVDHKMKENDSGNFHRPTYLVHYCGWSSKWDEWVDESRLVKMDENGLKIQAELLQQHGKGKARLKNFRKSNGTSPSKRTSSRSISDYSTSTNVDSVTTESPTVTHQNQYTIEETRSLSGRSDAGSSSASSISGEFLSTNDLANNNQDVHEPEAKKFKRTVNTSSKSNIKDKKSDSNGNNFHQELSPSIISQHETCQRLTRRFYTCQMEWLQFPSNLVEYLINDRDLINNQNNLLNIPPTRPNLVIRQVFQTYLDQQINECSLAEVLAIRTLISSLMDMFNIALGKCLLYRFERLQLRQLLEKDPSISLCDYYGSIHLLRFFWRIKDLLREMSANTSREEFGSLLGRIQHFLNYVEENRTDLFHSGEYDICSTEYYRCSLQCFQ